MLYQNKETGGVLRPTEYNKLSLIDRYDYEELDAAQEKKMSKKILPKEFLTAREGHYQISMRSVQLTTGFKGEDAENWILANSSTSIAADYIRGKRSIDEIEPMPTTATPNMEDEEEDSEDYIMNEISRFKRDMGGIMVGMITYNYDIPNGTWIYDGVEYEFEDHNVVKIIIIPPM